MYTEANPPKRAGDYSRFLTKPAVTLPLAAGAVVSVIEVDDWGPFKTPTLVNSFPDYLEKFGRPVDPLNPSPAYRAVYNAFRGENDDSPGAGGVLLYRVAAAAAAKATKTLAAGATPAALVLTAKYEGTRGNNYRTEVLANAADAANKVDLVIYDGTLVIDAYRGYGAADIVKLQTDINRRSKVLVASGATNGVKLTAIAASNLAGGNSGATPLAADYTAAQAALEPQQFGYLAATTTDTSIQTALITWTADLNSREKSKRFFLVLGGLAGETFVTAAARSAGANNENVVNWGVGNYRDTRLGLDFSSAGLAPRLAGILAARGGLASLTMAELQDIEIISGPSEQDILDSLTAGVVTVGLGSGGTVRFEKGVTSYVTQGDDNKPFDTFSKIKYVTTMQSFERNNRLRNENAKKIGRLPVNQDTREDLVADAQKELDEYIARKEVRPGAFVQVATDPQPSDDDEFVKLEWFGKFSRSLEQVRNDFYLS